MTQQATTITATYRIVTPMFCAGADQNSAELRLPSFKGALRFWWRSLMAGKVNGDYNELRRQEAKLFGASDQKTGQSRVRMRIVDRKAGRVTSPREVFENGRLAGAHYLGYGVMEAFPSRNKGTKAGQLTRAMIGGGQFTVECRFTRFATEDQIDQVRRALILLGTVGGLGSKSRKGYGSLTITALNVDSDDARLAVSPGDRLKECLGESVRHPHLPAWTAWSQDSRVIAGTANNTRTVELLDLIGREEVHFRSWGRNGNVLGEDSERNFPHDHDLSKGQRKDPPYPYRLAFGLPHNYGKGDQNSVQPDKHDRRASPLFIHIDQQDDRQPPTAVLAFLPSKLLPNGERVKAFGNPVSVDTADSLWFPIHAFLDRIVSNGRRPGERPGYESFPRANQWWQKKKASIRAQEVNLG